MGFLSRLPNEPFLSSGHGRLCRPLVRPLSRQLMIVPSAVKSNALSSKEGAKSNQSNLLDSAALSLPRIESQNGGPTRMVRFPIFLAAPIAAKGWI
jgi:hypothetical protein